jgi:hypothetical protein
VNDVAIFGRRRPKTHALPVHWLHTIEIIDMSEYGKMDEGLSCLSPVD